MGLLEKVKATMGLTQDDCETLAKELMREGHVAYLATSVGKGGVLVLYGLSQQDHQRVIKAVGPDSAKVITLPIKSMVHGTEEDEPVMADLSWMLSRDDFDAWQDGRVSLISDILNMDPPSPGMPYHPDATHRMALTVLHRVQDQLADRGEQAAQWRGEMGQEPYDHRQGASEWAEARRTRSSPAVSDLADAISLVPGFPILSPQVLSVLADINRSGGIRGRMIEHNDLMYLNQDDAQYLTRELERRGMRLVAETNESNRVTITIELPGTIEPVEGNLTVTMPCEHQWEAVPDRLEGPHSDLGPEWACTNCRYVTRSFAVVRGATHQDIPNTLEDDPPGIVLEVESVNRVYEVPPFPVVEGFAFELSGHGFNSGRPSYRVTCQACGQVVHEQTTGPVIRAEEHECYPEHLR